MIHRVCGQELGCSLKRVILGETSNPGRALGAQTQDTAAPESPVQDKDEVLDLPWSLLLFAAADHSSKPTSFPSDLLGHVGDDGLGAGFEEQFGFDEGSNGVVAMGPCGAGLGSSSLLHQHSKRLLQLHHLPIEDVVTHDEDGDALGRAEGEAGLDCPQQLAVVSVLTSQV